MTYIKALFGLCALLLSVSAAQAATITVCAAGCTYTNANLQSAINAAVAGDLILLQEGFDYVGNFTLPVKAGAGPSAITEIRTGVSSAGVVQNVNRYVPDNLRMCPSGYSQDWYSCATRSPQDMTRIAKMTANSNNVPALTTVDTASGSPVEYWKVRWIEFVANAYGGNSLIVISNDTMPSTTGSSLLYPGYITLDQISVRGLPVTGQFRGLQLEGRSVTLTNSHVADIKAMGEGQAVWGNGPGPYTVTNNYVSGGTETFFTGGGGTAASPELTISASPTPTATVFTVSGTLTDLYAEKQIAVYFPTVSVTSVSVASDAVVVTSSAHGLQVGWEVDFDGLTGCGTNLDYFLDDHPKVVSVTNTTTFTVETACITAAGSGGTIRPRFSTEITSVSGSQLTVQALPLAPPTTGAYIKTGITLRNLTARYNVFTHPSDWYTTPRIVPLPTGSNAACQTTGGTLATATTYGYRVLARVAVGQGSTADSGAAAEVSCTTASATSRVVVTWSAVANALDYRVYARTPGGQTRYFTVAAGTTTFTDTGSDTGSTVASVDTSASRWQLKNTFELKMCVNCTIEYNIIENSWSQGQTGPCVLFTMTQQNNSNFGSMIRDITFRYNEVRHCGQAVQLTGGDAGGDESSQTKRVNISQNLFWDIAGNYNGGSPAMIWSVGGETRQTPNRSAADVTIEHNTFAMDTSNDYTYAIYFANCHRNTTPTTGSPVMNAIIRNNIFYNGSYGLASENPTASPGCTWVQGRLVGSELLGTSVFSHNAIAGAAASCSIYTDDGVGNLCPTVADLEANTFTGPTNINRLNYVVKATSPLYNTGSDGTSYGPNIATIDAGMLITESGNNSGGGDPAPLTITTTTPLPAGTVGVAYNCVTFAATGGVAPYTFAHTVGVLPVGMTFDTGSAQLCGTPVAAVTNRSLTFRVTDNTAAQVSKVFTLSVLRYNVRAKRYNWSEGAFLVRPVAPRNPDDQLEVGDLWFDQATSRYMKLVDLGPEEGGGEVYEEVGVATGGGGGGSAPTFYVLAADVSKTTTGFSDITGLAFPVSANTNYDIVCQIAAVIDLTANGLGINWTGPASPTLTSAQLLLQSSNTTSVQGIAVFGNDTGTNTGAGSPGATTSVGASTPDIQPALFFGMWRNGANAGTVQMRWRFENTVTTGTNTIKAGSYCKVTVF